VATDDDRSAAARYTLHALDERHTDALASLSAEFELAATYRTHGRLVLIAERLADHPDFLG
jgi:hypothetical protein